MATASRAARAPARAPGRRPRTPDRRCATRRAGRHDLAVVAAEHAPPAVGRLRAPVRAERRRRAPGEQRLLLTVHQRVDRRTARRPGTRNRGPGAPWLQLPHRCERRAVGMVSATNTSSSRPVAQPPLGVDGRDRAESTQRLVDQVAAEVAQRAAARGGGTGLGVEPLEAGLEPGHLAERRRRRPGPHRQEVGVPPPVLVGASSGSPSRSASSTDGSAGGRVERERLVGHDGEPELERLDR